jgi:hypothetical protein
VNGGTGTTIRTGGLFNNLFNGNLKKKIADFKKENAAPLPEGTMAWNLPGVKEAWARGEDWQSLA